MQTVQHKKLVWHYFKEPNAEDVLTIQEKYKIHPLIIEEFSTPTLRPKAAQYDNCLFMSIHIPLFDTKIKTTYAAEIDIVICENVLITSHDKDIFQLTDFFNELANDKSKRELYMASSPGALMRFLNSMKPDWNISLFHYRNQGADYGQVLIGIQVPAGNKKAFRDFLAEVGYQHWNETENPAYRLFL